ncbi:uncharacterized protein LOC143857019 [Tasmannia lanceolata]|uniref:uncharacterized protein LOC143857019 n=1 Tax=Tasmannia lanceolata TaxID=3420 RepID=UPI004063E555
MSKSAERCLPFFKTLRTVKDFQWTEDFQATFDQLKVYLQELPLLSKPVPGESLYLSLAVGSAAINWAVELGEFDIQINPRPAIKSQSLADFIVECTVSMEELEETSLLIEESTLNQQHQNPLWMLYVDGSSNAGGNGAGLVITGPDNFIAEYALRLDFKASNNKAEYEALIAGIALAAELQVSRIRVHSDSQLVVNQVNSFSEAKEERIIKYLEKVRREISVFEEFQIVQVPRTLTACADALSKITSSGMFEQGNVYTDILPQPSVEREEVLQPNEEPSWMDPIIQYLKDGIMPPDRKEARRLVVRAVHYVLDGQKLYKHSFSWPLLKCLQPSAEVFSGQPSNKTLLTLLEGASNARRPFPNSTRGHRMMYVAIDYFTKWVEAKAVKKITSRETENFFYHDIICRFGVRRILVTNNGTQFASRRFKDFAENSVSTNGSPRLVIRKLMDR